MKNVRLTLMLVFTANFLNAQDSIFSLGQYGTISKYSINSSTGTAANPTFFGDGVTDKSKAIAVNSSGIIYYINEQVGENRGKIDIYAITDGSSAPVRVIDQFDMNDMLPGSAYTINDTKTTTDVFSIDKNGVAWVISKGTTPTASAIPYNCIFKFQTNADGSVGIPKPSKTISLPVASGGNNITDIAFNDNGDMFALLTGDGPFYSYIGTVSKKDLEGTSDATIKIKWILYNPATERPLIVRGNGLCFTSTGNLMMSASDGIYFIDQATINQPFTGFAHASKVYNTPSSATIEDLASIYYPSETALPVIFDIIKASMNDERQLNVNWGTSSERNNSHFDIELSKDGKSFLKIGTVASKAVNGNSDNELNYKFSISFEKASAMLSLLLLPLFALVFNRKNTKLYLAFSFIGYIFFIGCKKNYQAGLNKEDHLFIRITQVDLNGEIRHSNIVAVQQ